MPHSASDEYLARLAARRTRHDALTAADARFAHARLATFAAAVVLVALVWRTTLSPWWLLAPVAVFVWLVRRHDRVLRSRDRALRGMAFYERGLARLEDRWVGTGETGDRFHDDRHVYANDLDLFGRGSLFELLSLARTRTGEETLARWLKFPAEGSEIRARQEAVEELGAALDFREQLALAGTDVRTGVHTDRVLDWAEAPMPAPHELRVFTWLFSAAVLATISYAAIASTWWPLGTVLVLQAVVFRCLRAQMNTTLSGRDLETTADFVADALSHRALDLDVVADLLKNLEREHFVCERLALLRGRLSADGRPASQIIRRLHRLADIHDSERNTVIIPLGLFLLGQYADAQAVFDRWTELALSVGALLQLVRPHVAVAVDRWRRRYGVHVRIWFETVAQFEGLTSLSAYRYEHKDDPFPQIVSTGAVPRPHALFDGIQLGHPLLPTAGMVRNDVHLSGGGTQLLVVSGSNMSGKSTLLRTVGINAVLALAGAPVTRRVASALAAGGRRNASDSGLASGWALAILRRDYAYPGACRHCGRSRAASLSARRALPRHQFARQARGRCRRAQ